jgi:hypothetical protein
LAGLTEKSTQPILRTGIFVVNTSNGAASLLARNSGIPASPFVLGSQNADGTLNFGDEAIWQSGGKLYATYDAWVFNPTSFTVVSVAVAPELYQIDPTTGIAAVIGPTALGIGGVVDVNGTDYAFDDFTNQILALDLANGSTSVVGKFDPSAGVIQGAAPVPEPSSLILLGAAVLGFQIFRRRCAQHEDNHNTIASRWALHDALIVNWPISLHCRRTQNNPTITMALVCSPAEMSGWWKLSSRPGLYWRCSCRVAIRTDGFGFY